MVENKMLLHFLPRSLQLNMSKNNTNEKPNKGSLNPSASDSKKKKREEEEDAHGIEEDYPYKEMKKNKSNDCGEVSQELNKRSAGFYQLEDLIAGFLSSRGLSSTLSSFLSETQHEFTRKAPVNLEDMYHYYCNKICVSPRKESSAEGKVNREITFGKANLDAHMIEENNKRKDNKGNSLKNCNAHVATPFIKTPNGFSKAAKAHASEIDFQRSKKSEISVSEVVNNLSGLEDGKITEKVNKNLEPVIRTHKSSVKLSNASNKLEQVFDFAEPFYKSEKSKGTKNKEMPSDEMNVTDNDKQSGGKKSKKVTILEEEVQPMKYHASHTEPNKGKTADLRQDLENPTNIRISKKGKKKKKKTKSDDTSPGDDGELGDTGVKITMALRKSGATYLNNAKRESKAESMQDLSVEPSSSPNFKVSKEKRKKSSQMVQAEPIKGKAADLRQDLENPTNIEVSKKGKKKKKTKSDDTSPVDDGELGDTGVKITMALKKSGATDLNNAKRESKAESMQDLSVEPSTSPDFKVLKEKRKKSSQMAQADNKKKNKKVKKSLEELQATFSHTINGGTKGDKESLSEDTCNTKSISLTHKAFEMKRSLISESLALEKSSTDTISQNRGMPGKEDGAVETKKFFSPKTKEDKQEKLEMVKFVEPMLGDNSYGAKDGAENGYGAKAQEFLGQVRGKGFRHEKTKKKRGSYTGGTIDLQSNSIKFRYSDTDE